jgi:hypothetical protein
MTQARFEVIDVETGKTVATLAPEEWHEMLAAWELLDALEQAVQALNTPNSRLLKNAYALVKLLPNASASRCLNADGHF